MQDVQTLMQLLAELRWPRGRFGRVNFKAAVGSSAPVQILEPSYKRCGIIFSCSIAAVCALGNDASLTINSGFPIALNFGPIYLTEELHGDIVKKPWYAITSAGNANFGIIEIVDETKCYEETSRVTGMVGPWNGHS